MALTDLQIKVASEEAVFGLSRHMAPLGYFAHNFSPQEDKPFAGVSLGVYDLSSAAEYNAESNNWGNATDIDGAVVTLDKEFIKCCALPD